MDYIMKMGILKVLIVKIGILFLAKFAETQRGEERLGPFLVDYSFYPIF